MKPLPGLLLCLLVTLGGAAPVNASDRLIQPGDLILNQAADAIVGYLKLAKPLGQGATREMAETALRGVVDQYQGTNVSHLFWNVCYQRAAYRSDAWASYWDLDDPEHRTVSWPRLYYQLHKLGLDDAFAILIDRSRERGISPWVSLRMNDMHYNEDPQRMNPFWNEHPEFWLLPKPGFNNGFDFVQPAVRQHCLKLVGEVLSRWDIDGIELDWMRFPNLFKPGEDDDARAALNDFMRQVRGLADQASQRLGHRVGIAARVPATPEFAFGKGLDAVTWAREHLVDVLIPGSLWRPSFPDVPVAAWREQCGDRCSIVPGTDLWLRGYSGGDNGATSLGLIRGFTASMLDQGADAVYLFNHFEPCTTKLSRFTVEAGADPDTTLGDLLTVAGDPIRALDGLRRTVLTYHDPVPSGTGYRPPLPAALRPDEPVTYELHSGPAPTSGTARVWVGLARQAGFESAELQVLVNGTAGRALGDVPRPAAADEKPRDYQRYPVGMAPWMVSFEVPPADVRRGPNTVEVTLTDGLEQQLVWLELRFAPGPAE